MKRGSYHGYTSVNKLQIVSECQTTPLESVAKKYNIPPSTLRNWRKKNNAGEKILKGSKRCKGGGRKPILSKEEEEGLVEWVETWRKRGAPIDVRLLKAKAQEINPQPKKYGRGTGEFKASTRQRSTNISAEDRQVKIRKFWSYIINIRKEKEITPSRIYNMDEVPVLFDNVQRTVIDKQGCKHPVVVTKGSDKRRCTVVLTCSADGRLFPPMIIFKGKNPNHISIRTCPRSRGTILTVQPKAWMMVALMHVWQTSVFLKKLNSTKMESSLLVLDIFSGHKDLQNERRKIEPAFKRHKVFLAWVPGGCTPLVQPLDVSINHPFKTRLRQKWQDWMLQRLENIYDDDDGYSTEKEGKNEYKVKPPTKEDIVNWVEECWYETSAQTVINAFLCTGISNSLNVTEDDLNTVTFDRLC